MRFKLGLLLFLVSFFLFSGIAFADDKDISIVQDEPPQAVSARLTTNTVKDAKIIEPSETEEFPCMLVILTAILAAAVLASTAIIISRKRKE